MFSWLECKLIIFAVFVKTPLLAEDKGTVYQRHRFWDPELDPYRSGAPQIGVDLVPLPDAMLERVLHRDSLSSYVQLL